LPQGDAKVKKPGPRIDFRGGDSLISSERGEFIQKNLFTKILRNMKALFQKLLTVYL
jgi:hypothetical protein